MMKPRVHPQANDAPQSGVWSAGDRACLQHRLDALHRRFRKQPMGFLTSEGSALLCAPQNEIYDRFVSILSNISIVSGLVLSAIAGVALNPYQPEKFEAVGKQFTAELYNVVAAITVAGQLCTVLYSTFTLYIVTSTAHTPTAAYRSLAHSLRFLGFLEFMTFVPALGSFVLIMLACHLHCSPMAFYIVLGVVGFSVVSFQLAFNHTMMYAFPYNNWAWGSVFMGAYWLYDYLIGKQWLEKSARAHGERLIAQASEGVLGGLDEDGDYAIDDDDSAPAAAAKSSEAELAAWAGKVLHNLKPTKCGLLARGLHGAGLTRSRMLEAVQHSGGYETLCAMLASSELRLQPGERLALASAAMREAAAETSAGRE